MEMQSLSLLGQLYQCRSTYTEYGPLCSGHILVLGELGGEKGTARLRTLPAPGVCLERLRKARGIPEVTSSLHSAVICRLTPMCRGYLQLLQCPEQVWGKKPEMFSVFQCLQAKIQRASGGFGSWGAVTHRAALSFPPLFFHSWMAFKTLAGASQRWKTWREGQTWYERFVLVLTEQDCWQPRAGSLGSGLVANPLLIHKVNYLVLWSRPALSVRIHVPDR